MGQHYLRHFGSHSIGRGLAAAALLAGAAVAADMRAGNDAGAATAGYVRSGHRYALPAVSLVNQEGQRIVLGEVLPRDSAVALTFVYTRCGTVCPLLSRTLATLRKQMHARVDGLRVVSISIDPEHDTPERLQEYASRYAAGGSWQFYTGAPADIDEVLHAFEAVPPIRDKHRPLTLVRAANSDDWTRLDGVMTSDQLAAELKRIQKRQ